MYQHHQHENNSNDTGRQGDAMPSQVTHNKLLHYLLSFCSGANYSLCKSFCQLTNGLMMLHFFLMDLYIYISTFTQKKLPHTIAPKLFPFHFWGKLYMYLIYTFKCLFIVHGKIANHSFNTKWVERTCPISTDLFTSVIKCKWAHRQNEDDKEHMAHEYIF